MSESSTSEKTEDPTPKREREAREEGQVARSVDCVTTTSLFFVLGAVVSFFPSISATITSFTKSTMALLNMPLDVLMLEMLREAVHVLLSAVFPIALAAAIGVTLGNVIQFGFLVAPKAIEPKLSKINPIEGFKRIFSLKNLMEMLKSALKITILATLLYVLIVQSIGQLVMLPFSAFDLMFEAVRPLLLTFIICFLIAYILLSIVDFIIQKRLNMRELRMTKDEVKREHHDTEGDPQIKGNRKRLAKQMIFEDTATATKKSSVLVTNPTHFAAGIYYDPQVTHLPVLRAKGSGSVALNMIDIAYAENIPIVENIPLARALVDELEIGDVIPENLMQPVMEILRWVWSLRKQQ